MMNPRPFSTAHVMQMRFSHALLSSTVRPEREKFIIRSATEAVTMVNGLDLVTSSVLGALGCDMAVFLRYFPAAGTMYQIFVALFATTPMMVVATELKLAKLMGGSSESRIQL